MRTDCKVTTDDKVRLPQIPFHSPGRNTYAERGNFVSFTIGDDPLTKLGRVIGFVTADDIEGKYLIVAMLISGLCCEHWVNPAQVKDCWTLSERFYDKMQWLFGPNFLRTPVNKARQCHELLVKEMMIDTH